MKSYDYTTFARSFVHKHPIWNMILIQMSFWMWALLFLVSLMHIIVNSMIDVYQIDAISPFGPALLSGAIMGLIYGFFIGCSDILFEKDYFKKIPIGLVIFYRIMTYLLIMIILIKFMRFVWIEEVLEPYFFESSKAVVSQIDPKNNFMMLLLYTAVMSLVISFIKQMNKKFGPGVLLPMMLGKYRNPREEQRLFMFMDLKSSTSHAEKLGHIKYSSLIRDSFFDINQVLTNYNAEVYQYVGDEIVLSWVIEDGLQNSKCFEFFFAVQDRFNAKKEYYENEYGLLPQFKAGLHMGMVTAVEVGEIKRDIAYHGDTLNTAARIQSICNEFDKTFLISFDVKDQSQLHDKFELESLGEINLKGKDIPVEVFSVLRST